MSHAQRASDFAMKRDRFRIHYPVIDQPSSNSWLINGYPARIIIWTAEEWAKLSDRPLDAQPYPNGIWCALRID
jgi:hypothetical protein